MNDTRSLARIVTIDGIIDAVNANRLDIAVVGGWQVVVPKGLYSPGDKVIYAEIDSQIPVEDERFSTPDWMTTQAKDIDGVLRYTIRTARLRGNLSQGIIFNLEGFPDIADSPVGENVTDHLGITKEPDVVHVSQDVVGAFPDKFMIKSDSDRVQNLDQHWDDIREHEWIVTEKIDGMSIGVINDNGSLRVASHNNEIRSDDHAVLNAIDREEFLSNIPDGYAVQGELFGPKIQKNRLKVNSVQYRIFNVYRNGIPVPYSEWNEWMIDNSVPMVTRYGTFHDSLPDTVMEIVDYYNGMKSLINPDVLAEGVVLMESNNEMIIGMDRPTFKVISNDYLLKN